MHNDIALTNSKVRVNQPKPPEEAERPHFYLKVQ